jgi:hypothetical protein
MKSLRFCLMMTAAMGIVGFPLTSRAEPIAAHNSRSPERTLTQQRKAMAAIAVAAAALQIADERALLPNRGSQQTRFPETPLPDHPPIGDHVGGVHVGGDHAVADPVADRVEEGVGDRLRVKRAGPMQIEFLPSPPVSDTLSAQLVVAHWRQGCAAGDRQERDLLRVLGPLGWRMGHSETDQIRFVPLPQHEPCPQLTLYQNGAILRSWNSYQNPAFLSQELRRAWDTAPTSLHHGVTAGSAGAIHARTQIDSAITWWRQTLGEGSRVSVRWDRTGAQTFPLLAQGDWSAVALFGQSGRVEVSWIGHTSIPIKSLGFAYRVLGEDLSLDFDPILVQGLAQRLTPSVRTRENLTVSRPESGEPQPSRLGLITIWTITSVVRELVSLLNPTCDLQLGGNLSATAALQGDQLAIDFQQPPSIKLVALFTFQLAVQRVEISTESVRLIFTGSRLVKERTFVVK